MIDILGNVVVSRAVRTKLERCAGGAFGLTVSGKFTVDWARHVVLDTAAYVQITLYRIIITCDLDTNHPSKMCLRYARAR